MSTNAWVLSAEYDIPLGHATRVLEESLEVGSTLEKAEELMGKEIATGHPFDTEEGFRCFFISKFAVNSFEQKDFPWVRYNSAGVVLSASAVEKYAYLKVRPTKFEVGVAVRFVDKEKYFVVKDVNRDDLGKTTYFLWVDDESPSWIPEAMLQF